MQDLQQRQPGCQLGTKQNPALAWDSVQPALETPSENRSLIILAQKAAPRGYTMSEAKYVNTNPSLLGTWLPTAGPVPILRGMMQTRPQRAPELLRPCGKARAACKMTGTPGNSGLLLLGGPERGSRLC